MNNGGLITFGVGLTIACIGLISVNVGMIWMIALGVLVALLGVIKIALKEKLIGEPWKAYISFFIAVILGLLFYYLVYALSQFY